MLTLDITVAVDCDHLSPTPPNSKEDTLEIPTLPDTARRIIELRINPNAVASELAEIVESDPSLLAQVVSWAPFPYSRALGKMRSVQDAID